MYKMFEKSIATCQAEGQGYLEVIFEYTRLQRQKYYAQDVEQRRDRVGSGREICYLTLFRYLLLLTSSCKCLGTKNY